MVWVFFCFYATNSNDTPLIFAAYNGHADVVKVLIAAGADVNATNGCVMLRMIMNILASWLTPNAVSVNQHQYTLLKETMQTSLN
jgi:ankyrin repeat protein